MSDVLKRFDNVLNSVTKETERICGEVYGCLKEHPRQFDPPIYDYVHGGIYTRTMFLPKGAMIMGALIKVPTTLVISGSCFVSDVSLCFGKRFIPRMSSCNVAIISSKTLVSSCLG